MMSFAGMLLVPPDMQGGRLAEDEAAGSAWPGGVLAQPRQLAEQRSHRRERLGAGQVRAEAEVRAVREREMPGGVAAADVIAAGIGKDIRIPVRARDRYGDRIARPDRGPAQPHGPRRVPVHHGGGRLDSQRLLDRAWQQRRIFLYQTQLPGVAEQMPDRVEDHPFGGLDPA